MEPTRVVDEGVAVALPVPDDVVALLLKSRDLM